MVRPIPSTAAPGPRYTIANVGDSLSENQTWGVPQHLMWSALLQPSLRTLGCRVRHRNLARNGSTTTQMLARIANATYWDVPRMLIVFAGVNDPGGGISNATTQANIQAMVTACFAAGTQYAVIVSPQFLNYTSGGESTGQSKPAGTYSGVYDAQVAAVAALAAAYPGRVAFCDLWDWMRDLIVAGTDTLASASWHVAGTNQHLNAYGQRIVRDAILAAIQAQSGWLDGLTRG
jgi:lysophospholipase L1-like esterase